MDFQKIISSLPVPEWIATTAASVRQEPSDDNKLTIESPPASNNSLPFHGITTRQTSTPSTLAFDDDTDASVSTILTTTTASSFQHASFSAADLEGFADTVKAGLDVFPGKGEAIKRLNYHYRLLIRDYHLAYTGANSDISKNQTAYALLQEILRKGGNFLKNKEGVYMSEKESLVKIKKALKDYKTKENRRIARQKSVARRLRRQPLTKQPSTRSILTETSHISQSTSVAQGASVAEFSYFQDESCHPPSTPHDTYPSTVSFPHEPLDVNDSTTIDQHKDDAEWMEMIDLLSALE